MGVASEDLGNDKQIEHMNVKAKLYEREIV